MKKKIGYLVFLIIPLGIFYSLWRKHLLKEDAMYTISTTIRSVSTLKNGTEVEHFYYVHGKRYKEFNSKDQQYKIICPNGRYIVSFSKELPWVCKILWNKHIADSLKIIPPNDGWTQIPVELFSDSIKIFQTNPL